jgi:hypothetical protein
MKPKKLQIIFIQWLNVVLQDSRWRAFIRVRLRESELPVIELTNSHNKGPRPQKPAAPNDGPFIEA